MLAGLFSVGLVGACLPYGCVLAFSICLNMFMCVGLVDVCCPFEVYCFC